jgi:hypothetical protein
MKVFPALCAGQDPPSDQVNETTALVTNAIHRNDATGSGAIWTRARTIQAITIRGRLLNAIRRTGGPETRYPCSGTFWTWIMIIRATQSQHLAHSPMRIVERARELSISMGRAWSPGPLANGYEAKHNPAIKAGSRFLSHAGCMQSAPFSFLHGPRKILGRKASQTERESTC